MFHDLELSTHNDFYQVERLPKVTSHGDASFSEKWWIVQPDTLAFLFWLPRHTMLNQSGFLDPVG